MSEDEETRINPGYPLSQLLKALSGTGELAQKRIKQWQQVLSGLFDGSLQFGSRTPVAETPPWVTLEVVHGGFATGNLAAAGPLKPYEIQKLKMLEKPAGTVDLAREAISQGTGRSALNLYFLSDLGRPELDEMLASGCFRITVPEEGALLIASWLMAKEEPERATRLVDTIVPFFERLRFYPEPHPKPLRISTGVFVQTAGQSIQRLRAKRPHTSVQRMNEALLIWTPLYDRAVSLFLETVAGDMPSLQTTAGGQLARAESGQPVVEGGWPCCQYPANWASRAGKLLQDYDAARALNSLCKKPEKGKENFARLREYLAKAIENPASLTGREVGIIRKILASYVTRHGAPSSERLQATRAMQEAMAQRPLHHVLAGVLADRLQDNPDDEGVPELQRFLGPLSVDEASRIRAATGEKLPQSIVAKAMSCLEAPLGSLMEQQIVPSSEVMATVLPLLTARIRVSAIQDPNLARVFESVYRAFRRRRSLLLLNLESQVRFEELPWIAAIEPWAGSDQSSREAAAATLVQATTLALETFPQTILPNKLIKELKALATAAAISPPLVDELAADIFMGTFSATFLRAAHEAARLLRGSLYERYYGLDYESILRLDDVQRSHWGAPTSPEFARLCVKLAGVDMDKGGRFSVARNGAIIEQSQILTTHNLASLFQALDLADVLRPKLPNLARHSFKWICRRLQTPISEWRAELQAIKNAAYAWRQMLFYLSLIDQAELTAFLAWSHQHLNEQTEEFRQRFSPAMQGLVVIAQGERFNSHGWHPSVSRRFLGWSLETHWLRAQKTGSTRSKS